MVWGSGGGVWDSRQATAIRRTTRNIAEYQAERELAQQQQRDQPVQGDGS
jgi:hypothetical protein